MIPVTAIVTAYQRVEQTLVTLRTLRLCDPAPAEILVHVDRNQLECAAAIRRAHPDIRVLVSEASVGPGGGRNLLIAAASCPIVSSFDDDSYPIDRDYFARVKELCDSFPDAAVIDAHVYHVGETIAADDKSANWVADFSGGACAYRRDHFIASGDYVPLDLAYGMEEVDLALRLHAQGRRVLRSPWLRVFHDTDRARHADPSVTAASVANLALLAFLRYPVTLWPVGALQCGRRLQWLLRNGRRRGIGRGLAGIPRLVLRYWRMRQPLPAAAVRSYLSLRRHPVPVPLAATVTGSVG